MNAIKRKKLTTHKKENLRIFTHKETQRFCYNTITANPQIVKNQ